MAGGGLVPHVLPNGQTIMVPDYLAPKGQGALSMPDVAKPSAPDMRVAGPGGIWGAPAPPPISQMVEPLKKATGWRDPATVAMPPPGTPTVANPQPAAPAAVDPSTLAEPGGNRAAAPGGDEKPQEWNPLVRQVFNEGGRGGGGPRRTGRREESSVTAERLPGKELLPELKWAMGIERRPDTELDTSEPFVADDPQYVKTPLERLSSKAGEKAQTAYYQQVNQEQQRLNAEREVLAQQSKALDDNLSLIAERRNRIAKLQETADQRMEEAKSFEPRTREQVWQEKGPAARVMGILAMALGGYVQGLGRSGGRNPGLDIVNQVINDAVEGDRYKAEKRMKVGAAAKSDYEKALALYGDPEAAMLEAKQRKLASTMGMLQNQLASRGLDEQAKMRGEQLYAAAEQQYLQNAQQLYDQLNGVVVKESINYKPEMVGGGGGGMTLQQRLKNAAEATKNVNIIEGKEGANPHQRSVEGDKLTELNKAFEAIESAEGVQADLKALGAESSDIDDPLSGPLDAIAAAVGTGGTGRRARQSLERNTENLARGIQIGASDNDAISADKRARADGSGAGRWATAEAAKRKSTARIQSTLAGMSPAMRQAYLDGLPPERRELVQKLSTESTVRHRAGSEQVVK